MRVCCQGPLAARTRSNRVGGRLIIDIHRHVHALALRLVAIAVLSASGAAVAQIVSAYGLTIDTSSLGPSPAYPGATSVWVLYDPGMSFDCSPPRGCLAKSQRINYTFNCAPAYAVITQRISYDLGGTEIRRETQDIQSADPSTYDAGARMVLATYCPVRDRRLQ